MWAFIQRFFFQNELRAKSNKFPTVGVDLLWYIINKIGWIVINGQNLKLKIKRLLI